AAVEEIAQHVQHKVSVFVDRSSRCTRSIVVFRGLGKSRSLGQKAKQEYARQQPREPFSPQLLCPVDHSGAPVKSDYRDYRADFCCLRDCESPPSSPISCAKGNHIRRRDKTRFLAGPRTTLL